MNLEIVFRRIPAFPEATQGPETLQQLLAIESPVQPRWGAASGQRGYGNRCFRTPLFDLQRDGCA